MSRTSDRSRSRTWRPAWRRWRASCRSGWSTGVMRSATPRSAPGCARARRSRRSCLIRERSEGGWAMQRPNPIQGVTQTVRRPLKIFATDPLLGRTFGNRARIDVATENLQPGPIGPRVEVLDYDGAGDCFYEPVDLNNPAVLMQGGLDPSESDPRFHQQMVY